MSKSEQETSRAPYPSRVTLPAADPPYPSLLEFLNKRFPKVGRVAWDQRLQNGQVVDATGQPVDCRTPYQPGLRLIYYREVECETLIPFKETVIFNNEHVLISCKPHFLPVVPAGKYVNECLLYRLRQKTGNEALVPMHRLDRDTAGLVLFSTNKKTRGKYGLLFEQGLIEKEYEAIALIPTDRNNKNKSEWLIESRIETSSHWLVMANVEGEINARTKIRLLETNENQARFQLFPLTGKQHQLRLHMNLIGSQITNDRFYPVLLPEQEREKREKPDFDRPLKLLAKRLSFVDPLSGERMVFESKRTLEFD